MKQYASVISGAETERYVRAVIRNIDKVINDLYDQKSSVIINNKLHTFGWADSFRLLIDGFDDCPLAYRNLILNSAGAVYDSCSLAVPLYLLTLQGLFSKKTDLTPEKLHQDVQHLMGGRKRTSSKFVKELWRKTIQDESTRRSFESICRAVDEAGALGTIEIKSGRFFQIATSSGVTISATLSAEFQARVAPIINLEDCKIIVVDGAVHSVSDLNRVLTHANETKSNMAIFASQFSSDVLNTLVVNWNSGRLKVLPLEFLKELDDLNQAPDLAMISGTVIITNDNGRTMTSIEEEEIHEVKSLLVDGQRRKCEITLDQKNIARMLTLRADIQKKRDDEQVQDVKDILSNRLARLTSRKTIVTLPCDITELGIAKDRTSDLFKLIKACSNEGVVCVSSVYKSIPMKTSTLPQYLPAFSTKLAILKAAADYKQINKIGALILVDR